ncbi:MAG TPA: DNA polymerase III subunit beta [Salinivirgaceae bacterium]|nr:DNA polymerase III subunit beta [Salinivirgaceae bacterium]
MKFVISSVDLLNQLQSAGKVIKPKNTLHALDCFLFSLSNKKLTITASDLDTTITVYLDLDIAEGEGKIGIDARRLISTLKEFNEPLTFDINTDNNSVEIISTNGKYSLVGISGDEYPEVPTINEDSEQKITLTAETLLTTISRTIFATSNDINRIIFGGIYFGFEKEKMVAAATDATILVRYRRKDITTDTPSNFILPNKPAGLLKAVLPKDDTSVEIIFDNKIAQIRFSTMTFICRLIEGTFPNFESIIPINPPNKMLVDRTTLQAVLRRVGLYANQSIHLVRFDINNTELVVSAQDNQYSISALERMPCSYEGESMSIGFKSIFLYEILDNLPGDEVLFEISEPSRAVLLLPTKVENENEDILSLIMPTGL